MKIQIVRTETKEQFIALLVLLEEQGYKWNAGQLPTSQLNYWNSYREKTYVSIFPGDRYNTLTYGNGTGRDCYESISVDAYMELHKPKPKPANLNKRLIAAVRECIK